MFLECCRASVLRLSSARKASKISDANVVGLVFLDCQAPETLVRLVTLFSLVTLVMPR